jgi:Ribbon-helix-helix protein, copG family
MGYQHRRWDVTDLLVRDLPESVVAALDANAARLGLSRSEYVRRRLTDDARRTSGTVTVADLDRFSQTFRDLADDDVMRRAWD